MRKSILSSLVLYFLCCCLWWLQHLTRRLRRALDDGRRLDRFGKPGKVYLRSVDISFALLVLFCWGDKVELKLYGCFKPVKVGS